MKRNIEKTMINAKQALKKTQKERTQGIKYLKDITNFSSKIKILMRFIDGGIQQQINSWECGYFFPIGLHHKIYTHKGIPKLSTYFPYSAHIEPDQKTLKAVKELLESLGYLVEYKVTVVDTKYGFLNPLPEHRLTYHLFITWGDV